MWLALVGRPGVAVVHNLGRRRAAQALLLAAPSLAQGMQVLLLSKVLLQSPLLARSPSLLLLLCRTQGDGLCIEVCFRRLSVHISRIGSLEYHAAHSPLNSLLPHHAVVHYDLLLEIGWTQEDNTNSHEFI